MNGRNLLSAYNLPGRLLAELWYLWPKKGQIWASGRRRSHAFVHFLYSTVFYLITTFVLLGSLQKGEVNRDSSAIPNSPELVAGYANSTGDQTARANELLDEASATEQPNVEPIMALDESMEEGANPVSGDKSDTPSLKEAMRKAFQTGQPSRWEEMQEAGFAIASEADKISGCRNVSYSLDARADWQSKPETFCP